MPIQDSSQQIRHFLNALLCVCTKLFKLIISAQNLKIHVLQTRAAEKDAKTKIVSPSLTTPLNDGREAETFKDRFLR